VEEKMRVGWVYDPRFLLHDPGGTHVECADRLRVIVETLRATGLLDRLVQLPVELATADQLALVHEPAYVEIVERMCEAGFTFIGSSDTGICSYSYVVAALAAGGVLQACDAVLESRVDRAFCAVRPPGHHAGVDQASGFCLFNHVALAAQYVVLRAGLKRIAIVDFDAHHGNGTQQIFECRRDVFYISLHERPESLHFPGTGQAREEGRAAGRGYSRNIPLDRGCGPQAYLQAMDDSLLPALHEYRPQMVLVSAGFDGLAWDSTAQLSLDPETYGPLTDRLIDVAQQHSSGRLISVLEGGYYLPQLGAAVATHVRALLR
jgi:acetoin utilization deacetylase AcuC-like enzyme